MTNASANTLTKIEQYSLSRLQLAIDIIEELVPLERKRESQKRRRRLERAYAIFNVHCSKLGFTAPRLSTFYSCDQYLANARIVACHIEQFHQSKGVR